MSGAKRRPGGREAARLKSSLLFQGREGGQNMSPPNSRGSKSLPYFLKCFAS